MRIKIENFKCPVEVSFAYFKDIKTDLNRNIFKNDIDMGSINIFDTFFEDHTNVDDIDSVISILIDDYYLINYFLESSSTGLQDLYLFQIPNSQTLLVGGKNKSCSIHLPTQKVQHIFNHFLFWGFCIHKNWILETGETMCLFRDMAGNIVDSVDVEPPWELFYEEDGIRFESDGITGTTFLKYPDKIKGLTE